MTNFNYQSRKISFSFGNEFFFFLIKEIWKNFRVRLSFFRIELTIFFSQWHPFVKRKPQSKSREFSRSPIPAIIILMEVSHCWNHECERFSRCWRELHFRVEKRTRDENRNWETGLQSRRWRTLKLQFDV